MDPFDYGYKCKRRVQDQLGNVNETPFMALALNRNQVARVA